MVSSKADTPSAVRAQSFDPDRVIRVALAKRRPKEVWYFLGCFIGLITLCHVLSLMMARFRRVFSPFTNSRLSKYARIVVNGSRVLAFRCTIPVAFNGTINVAEAILTAGYIAMGLAWSLANTTSTVHQKFDPKYYANIAGNIAASQLPLVTALGMKNNPISFLTGVSFDKLNYLHRMTARSLIILIFMHAGGRIHLTLAGDVSWDHPWIQAGLMAAIALSILAFFVRPIRDRNYEMFFVVHFVLVLIVLLGVYFHSQVMLNFGYFVWPSFLLWALDRVLRIIRMLVFHFSLPSHSGLDLRLDTLSPLFLRMSINCPKHFHWRAGQSVFLILPGVSTLPVESHPFTIAAADVQPNSDNRSEKVNADRVEKRLVFLIRIREGFTHHLANIATTSNVPKLQVLVDGPYSSPPYLEGFDTVILIAGGSGIAFCISLFQDVVYNRSCDRLVLVWAVRNLAHVDWVSEQLKTGFKDAPPSLSIEVHLFFTPPQLDSEENALDDDTTNSEDASDSSVSLLSSPLVKLEKGRPEFTTMFKSYIQGKRVSVNVCGTGELARGVRRALKDIYLSQGSPSVSLHVEPFGMVSLIELPTGSIDFDH